MSRGMVNWSPGVSPRRDPRATLHEFVQGHGHSLIGVLVDANAAALDQAVRDGGDVLRRGIARIEKVPRSGQRIEKGVGDAPGVSAFAEHDALDAEIDRRFADPVGDLVHLLVGADEQREVRRFGRIGAERPAYARLMKHLGVTDQAVDMRLGEEIGGGRHEEYVRALRVERKLHVEAGLVPDVLLQTFERVGERGRRQAEIVADRVDLVDDLVRVFLPQADRVHDLARGHGNLGGVDAVRAEDGAAPALRALVEIAEPLFQRLRVERARPDEASEQRARGREITPVDAAQKVLPRDRHVFRIAGAEEEMTLVGAGAALHADVEKNPQRPGAVEQLAHLCNCAFPPVLDQRARKAERLVVGGLRDERTAMAHRVRRQRRRRIEAGLGRQHWRGEGVHTVSFDRQDRRWSSGRAQAATCRRVRASSH